MTLPEFDKAVDTHRKMWRRAKYIARTSSVPEGSDKNPTLGYILYDYRGEPLSEARWTVDVAESLREQYGWERAKCQA